MIFISKKSLCLPQQKISNLMNYSILNFFWWWYGTESRLRQEP
jgi:hypothetical protein